ncbi:potassium-transporting ATPase subunit KdpC [Staphylococcus simulans]|uniref:potassium-transporting ATPase subunit KdpC n=1 Tax=Staphylococcus simulans TaxID=1286 RepID=UPI000D029C7E|nr:potassium-transporting ATPase subunit KdpC [Staphylococcus simulans]
MHVFRNSLGLVIMMLLLCGFIFPLAVTGAGQVLFNEQANGSLVKQDGKVVGSKLIGQQWTDAKYFHGRISAVDYNMDEKAVKENGGPASGGSNFGNTNPKLKERVEQTIDKEGKELPVDAVTASGSGLDPDITVQNANRQAERIAKERNISPDKVKQIIQHHKQTSPMAEPYVNVLKMNIALDQLKA